MVKGAQARLRSAKAQWEKWKKDWKRFHDLRRCNMEKVKNLSERLMGFLRLKTQPVGVSYLPEGEALPPKARRPRDRKIQITLCQAMTWARIYGWSVAIEKEDNVCIPGGLALNLLKSTKSSNEEILSRLMVEVGWVSKEREKEQEWYILDREYKTILMEPLSKANREPELVVIYGDPSQIVKLVHGYSYTTGKSITTRTSGRVACSDYLAAPLLHGTPVIAIPGTGDRVFSGTQDTEMISSIPYSLLESTIEGMKEAGAQVGSNRYPFVPYMLHQVQFPPIYKELARETGIQL